MPELAIKCLDSWNKYLPDYEIVRWDENNFDINTNLYVKQAYEAKKFAFVSDYVRLYALFNHGGIYMDTDVEVLQPLDMFLNHKAFSGFESYIYLSTCIMACEKGFTGFNELLELYKTKRFIKDDGTYDVTTNVAFITDFYVKKGLLQNNTLQTIEGLTIYPEQFFCPRPLIGGKHDKEAYIVHHFAGSWRSAEEQRRKNSLLFKTYFRLLMAIRQAAIGILGKDAFEKTKGLLTKRRNRNEPN